MISPTAEYALRAIVAIAQASEEPITTEWIARVTRVPPGYLCKVLQTLGKAGLVDSRRGMGGGFRLARPADQISVLEVVNAVDPLKRITRCPLDLASHGSRLCPLHKRLDDAFAQVERSFAASTIAELLAEPTQSTPFCDRGRSAAVKLRVGRSGSAGHPKKPDSK